MINQWSLIVNLFKFKVGVSEPFSQKKKSIGLQFYLKPEF